MTEITDRVEAALRKELGAFTSPAILEAAVHAAIEAMREPTEAMCDAVQERVAVPPDVAWHVWKAMIDAALDTSDR